MIRSATLPACEVVEVAGPAAEREFLELPYRLYRDDPLWVPPLRSTERDRWSPRTNPSLRTRWTRRFLVRRGGEALGRVAAVVDPAFSARWLADSGFFGSLECADDVEAARALLGAAEGALARWGVRRVLGPVNVTTHDETGMLVAGFDSRPTVMSPYNPAYLPALVDACGYAPFRDYHSYRWTPDRGESPAVGRVAAASRTRASLASRTTIRPLDPSRWDSDIRAWYEVYNEAFDGVWGHVPMDWDEMEQRARAFRSFVRPELVLFAEREGRVVGCTLTLPDVNEALAAAKGRLWPLGWLRLARALPRIRSAAFAIMAVRPGHTGRGLAVRLAFETARIARELGLRDIEASLVQAANDRMRHVAEAFRTGPCKTFRLFQKDLRQGAPASGGGAWAAAPGRSVAAS